MTYEIDYPNPPDNPDFDDLDSKMQTEIDRRFQAGIVRGRENAAAVFVQINADRQARIDRDRVAAPVEPVRRRGRR